MSKNSKKKPKRISRSVAARIKRENIKKMQRFGVPVGDRRPGSKKPPPDLAEGTTYYGRRPDWRPEAEKKTLTATVTRINDNRRNADNTTVNEFEKMLWRDMRLLSKLYRKKRPAKNQFPLWTPKEFVRQYRKLAEKAGFNFSDADVRESGVMVRHSLVIMQPYRGPAPGKRTGRDYDFAADIARGR